MQGNEQAGIPNSYTLILVIVIETYLISTITTMIQYSMYVAI